MDQFSLTPVFNYEKFTTKNDVIINITPDKYFDAQIESTLTQQTHYTFHWFKARIRYFIHNWIYTTNHKRIAINYFLFVILAGIVGLILATAIRLEFAYPGVGIFAGDSLQYLTVASAHGVIMVFFMIMPLLFGAFANFLLPTQLGVHDVAFPRLNSAAFWFLPGGLIMLAQMICVDRRYQRMNCFNVREIESLLKQKFFTGLNDDVIWTHRLPLSISALRFQQNGTISDVAPVASAFTSVPKKMAVMRVQPLRPFRKPTIEEMTPPVLFYSTLRAKVPTVPPLVLTTLSHIASVWIYMLSFVMHCLQLIKSFSLFGLDLLIYLMLLPSIIKTFASGRKLTSPSAFIELVEDNVYQLTNPLYYPWISIYGTSFYTLHRFDSYSTFLHDSFPVHELTVIAFEFNALVFDCVWAIIFNSYLFYIHQEDYFQLIPGQIWQHIQRYNGIYSEVEKCFWELMSISLILIGSNVSHARIHSLNEAIENIELSSIHNTVEGLKFRIFLFELIDMVVYLCKYFWFLFTHGKMQNAWKPLYQTILWEFNEPSFLTTSHLLLATNALANTTNFIELIKSPLLIEATTIPMSDFSHIIRQTTAKMTSLVWQPSNFSNFVDVYYVYVTGFYELYRMRRLYFINFVHSSVVNITSISPMDQWLRINIERWSILVLLCLETIFNHLCTFHLNEIYLLSTITSLFIREVYSEVSTLLTVYPITGQFSVPSFVGFYWTIYSNFSKLIASNVMIFVQSSIGNRFQFFTGPDAIITVLKNKLNELFPLYQQLKNESKENVLKVEYSSTTRHARFSNPQWRYDYKTGDYFPKVSREQNTHLFPTLLMLSNSSPFTPWFVSSEMRELVETTRSLFTGLFNNQNFNDPIRPFSYDYLPIFTFYALSFNSNLSINRTPFAVWSSLNQQFYRLFLTSSLQQRVFSNWRQLKFTREAWRCKLLSARHQKTLYRRYLNEDGVFWSIERNARDLLPGWAMITPFSSRTRFTAVGKVDIGLMGVLLVLNSSIVSAANFLVTYRYLSSLNNRKMRDARSFFAEGVMVASWMMIAANPMLVIGIIMLLSDRHWQTSFFDYSGGGDTILFQHMFWFFGHPEVYIIMIPVFGFTNTTLSYYLRKRVSARASLMYSMYTIAFLGFFVWGHHMYMVGLAHTTRMLFSTLTVMISVPAATKLMHWCVTIANSSFVVELPLLFTLTFIFLFVSGGISGMCVAHTGMDVLFHDTFYVIGHFHVMLAGAAMFGSFGAFYFYFAAIFGVKYSRLYSYLHYSYYLTGQIITVAPMFWLGYAGMPRRVLDYPASLGGWHSLISGGHLLSVAGIISFFFMIFDSLRQARAALRTTLGINRYNTRLSFYLFEISRLKVVKQKFGYIFNFIFRKMLILRRRPLAYFEEYESTLITYTFRRRK